MLQDAGLVAALQAQARKSLVPTTVEALQNAAKYAGITSVTVRLAERDGRLLFDVSDDGAGFDPSANGHGSGLPGMADRLEALGGRLDVRSEIGHGTTIGGNLSVTAPEPASGRRT